MPRLPFRLATLLRLRETVRDRCRLELVESRRTDDDLRIQLARLSSEQERIEHQRRRASQPGAVNVEELLVADRYAAALRLREDKLHERRRMLVAEIRRRRESLLRADRDVRSLEKLRDRQQQQHRQESERRESKELDETALRTVQR